MAALPEMRRAVTCTTRAPRFGERDGIDYHFLDSATFERRVQAKEFLEHAMVYGFRYGTLKSEVLNKLREGDDVLLNVDVQGANAIRGVAAREPELRRALITVFLTPPSFTVLEQRLRKRATDDPEVIEARLRCARKEIAEWANFDYLLISSTVAEDLRRMLTIIESEGMRTLRATPPEV
jgi:guanylate kinase